MSNRSQRLWEQALLDERLTKAKKLYEKLSAIEYSKLDRDDQLLHDWLAWITLDGDEEPCIAGEYEDEGAV